MSDLAYQLAVRDAGGGTAEAFYRLGCTLSDMKRWGSAAGCFARVVELEPENYRAWSNLGWCRHLGGRSREGLQNLSFAWQLCPTEGTPPALMSQILLMMGDTEGAIFHGRRAVALEPHLAINHVALSFALMAAGAWYAGWKEYENRIFYKIPEFASRPYRMWRGEKVEHLYLEAEQGAGDCIFSLRWLPFAAERAEKVTLYVHGPLYSLVDSAGQLPGNVTVFPLPRPLPIADAWCPLMSLPVALETGEPFYDLSLSSYDRMGARVARNGGLRPRNIAICWSGSPDHEQAHHRDIPLAHFLPLAEVPGVRLHSVQVGPGQSQFADLACYGLISDRSVEITNFADTAKILAEMDLVISVDTAVAHLAGAMGVPCWLLLNRRGMDFRWGIAGETTGWYPSVRLFRRSLDEGWPDVLARVRTELVGLADAS